jgi:hypothetical protein
MLGHVHLPHAAFAEQAQDHEGADLRPDQRVRFCLTKVSIVAQRHELCPVSLETSYTI